MTKEWIVIVFEDKQCNALLTYNASKEKNNTQSPTHKGLRFPTFNAHVLYTILIAYGIFVFYYIHSKHLHCFLQANVQTAFK